MAKLVATAVAIKTIGELSKAPRAIRQRAVMDWIASVEESGKYDPASFEADKTFVELYRNGKVLLALCKALIPAFSYSKKGPADNPPARLDAVSAAMKAALPPDAPSFSKGDIGPPPPLPPKVDADSVMKVVATLEAFAHLKAAADFLAFAEKARAALAEVLPPKPAP